MIASSLASVMEERCLSSSVAVVVAARLVALFSPVDSPVVDMGPGAGAGEVGTREEWTVEMFPSVSLQVLGEMREAAESKWDESWPAPVAAGKRMEEE